MSESEFNAICEGVQGVFKEKRVSATHQQVQLEPDDSAEVLGGQSDPVRVVTESPTPKASEERLAALEAKMEMFIQL